MKEHDLKARLKELYLPPAKDFVLVDVPEMRYVMIDGRGAADRTALDHAVKWLFAAIYPIKGIARQRMGKDFVEPPLEGLWWADDMQDFISAGASVPSKAGARIPSRTPSAGIRSRRRSRGMEIPSQCVRDENLARAKLNWRMMIVYEPDWLTAEMFRDGVAAACGRLGQPPESLRLESYHEGLSAQIMHFGPPSAEAATIARLHKEFLPARGLTPNGHHHEIYLTDPNRTAPEKTKTVLRQPVRPSAPTPERGAPRHSAE
jgi:hypothetical protein